MIGGGIRRAVCTSAIVIALVSAGCSSGGTSTPRAAASASASAVAVGYDHLPGTADVSTMTPGQPFEARPNFHYFVDCGRPCFMPLYPQPQLIAGTAVTSGWPCEARDLMSPGGFCNDSNNTKGDWIHVVCQVTGVTVQNEHLLGPGVYEQSDVYDVADLRPEQMKPDVDLSKLEKEVHGTYRVYAPDLWFGDTSRDPVTHKASLKVHNLPC